MKLYLKGERCYTDKCALRAPPVSARASTARRRSQAHASTACSCARSRRSPHLRRARAPVPRLLPRGDRDARASPARSCSQLLERRLDNVVYRMGFARVARRGAPARAPRPLHVNGKRVNIPSLPRPRRRQDRGPREEPRRSRASTRRSPASKAPRRSAVARARQGRTSPAPSRRCPMREDAQRACRSASSSSSSTTRSKSDCRCSTRQSTARAARAFDGACESPRRRESDETHEHLEQR